ncbi:MAG: hypothetical protein GY811_24390 [Myxococcales bacterium]|nr:hypothetical protein [Myxococcales bacterium]
MPYALAMSHRARLLVLFVAALVAFANPGTAKANSDEVEVTTPPPISGHRIENPKSIDEADVMERLPLAHNTLEEVRRYMGKPAPPKPM